MPARRLQESLVRQPPIAADIFNTAPSSQTDFERRSRVVRRLSIATRRLSRGRFAVAARRAIG
jgi:hypothetical protein